MQTFTKIEFPYLFNILSRFSSLHKAVVLHAALVLYWTNITAYIHYVIDFYWHYLGPPPGTIRNCGVRPEGILAPSPNLVYLGIMRNVPLVYPKATKEMIYHSWLAIEPSTKTPTH